jgi:hypothetical protein
MNAMTTRLQLLALCSTMSCSCAAIHQYSWNVNIECLIEYPCDPLPRQGVNFRARNWHSLTLTANVEFNQKGWSIGDSNPGPLPARHGQRPFLVLIRLISRVIRVLYVPSMYVKCQGD